MSSDDVLARAARAMREGTDGASTGAPRTRARVLARASLRGRRRSLVVTLAPLAAVLAAFTAWASTNGSLSRIWHDLESTLSLGEAASPPATSPPRPHGSAHKPAHAREPANEPAPANEPDAPRPLSVASAVPVVDVDSLPRATALPQAPLPSSVGRAAPSSAPTPPPVSSVEVEEETPSEGSLLYAAAHRAHFVDHDPAAALRAWDAYLRAAPAGLLVPEARYDRALTLVRLGRLDEARTALAPFAAGAYGTYRAREAREILGALGDGGGN